MDWNNNLYTILKLLQTRSAVGRVLVVAVITALVLGLIGHIQLGLSKVPADERTVERTVKIVLDSVPASMRVFTPKISPNPGTSGWLLTIGELLGALAAFAAILAVLGTILHEFFEKIRVSWLKDHTILIGLDENALLFLDAQASRTDSPAVVLDMQADEGMRKRAHTEGCYHYTASDKREIDHHLKACAASRAARIVICTGDDTLNLDLIRNIAETNALQDCEALDVLLVVRDSYTYRHLDDSDTFMQSLGTGAHLRLFSPAHASAANLMSKMNLAQLAREQGQNRVNLVICGQDETAVEVVTQYLKVSPTITMPKPQIHWLVADRPQIMRELSETSPALAGLIRNQDNVPLAWAADIQMHQPDADQALCGDVFLSHVLQDAEAPTAIVITGAEDDQDPHALQTAVALREAARRNDTLAAPIFVLSRDTTALDQFIVRLESHRDALNTVIEPFGRVDEMQGWGGADASREKLAKALHEKYLAQRAAEPGGQEGPRNASNQPWPTLPETYKNANRRGADHLRMIVFWRDVLTNGEKRPLSPDETEALAELEHDAWSIDRELDGWRYGEVRDNARKRHPDLIPYADLTDDIQEYDRAQVRTLLEVADES